MAIDTASLDLAGDVLLYDVGVTSLLFFFLLIICTADNDVLNHWFKDVFGILAKKYEGSNGGPFFVMWAAIGSLYLGSVSLWASSAAWSVKHVVILLNSLAYLAFGMVAMMAAQSPTYGRGMAAVAALALLHFAWGAVVWALS